MFMYLYICFPFRNIYIYNYQGINSKLSIAAIYITSGIAFFCLEYSLFMNL